MARETGIKRVAENRKALPRLLHRRHLRGGHRPGRHRGQVAARGTHQPARQLRRGQGSARSAGVPGRRPHQPLRAGQHLEPRPAAATPQAAAPQDRDRPHRPARARAGLHGGAHQGLLQRTGAPRWRSAWRAARSTTTSGTTSPRATPSATSSVPCGAAGKTPGSGAAGAARAHGRRRMDTLTEEQVESALQGLDDWTLPGRGHRPDLPLRTTSSTPWTSSNRLAEVAEERAAPSRHRHPLQQGHAAAEHAQRRRGHPAGRGPGPAWTAALADRGGCAVRAAVRRRRASTAAPARARAAAAPAACPAAGSPSAACYNPHPCPRSSGDRARASGARGRRFESFRGHQSLARRQAPPTCPRPRRRPGGRPRAASPGRYCR